MSLILPPPIAPEHPRPWWCPRCGQLEAAGCNHPLGGPPRPLPPRPVPRHLRAAAPTPRQRAATARADQRATTRRRRVLDALARIGGAA